MPLHPEPDTSHAAWFTTSKAPWTQLCSLGPGGFEKYGRIFHPLPEGADEHDPDELVNVEGHLDESHLKRLLPLLARHTRTPDDCFFGLWDGFGDLHGSPAVGFFHTGKGKGPDVPPAFPPEFLNGPRVEIPNRSYLLFRGPLAEAGRWGAADLAPGHPRPINSPNLMWPSDHAWFVASEIDVPWTGVAGSPELLAEFMADSVLDAELVDPTSKVPHWRHP
jgi:hypothetical protein